MRCFINATILALVYTLQAIGACSAAQIPLIPSDPLAHVRLGESLKDLYQAEGEPWIVAYQSKVGYWAYSIDQDRAWLVVGVAGGTVHSAQIIAKAHQRSDLRDGSGVTLGDKPSMIQTTSAFKDANGERVVEIPQVGGAGAKRFYGLSKKTGLIDRIGKTLDDVTLPILIRWYAFTGWTPDRAIPLSLSRGTPDGEARYLHGLKGTPYVVNFQCIGGNAWEPISRTQTSVDGARLDVVRARCGASSYTRKFYFALTTREPRPFDGDEYSQTLLSKAGVGFSPMQQRKRLTSGTVTPQVWFTAPNGTRALNGSIDVLFAFVYDPANPPTAISFSYATDGSAPSLMMSHGVKARLSTLSGFSMSCSFSLGSGNGSGKCAGSLPAPTPPCPTLSGDNGMSMTTCFPATVDPKDQPHPSRGSNGQNGNAAGGGWDAFGGIFGLFGSTHGGNQPDGPSSTGNAGCPVYAVSGKLWYTQQDFSLSGPFGMLFQHRYDSDLATYQADLGTGWRHAYGAYLDLTGLSNGGVIFYDANCNREYFGTVGPGTTVYDQFSGGSLTTTASGSTITGFAVTTWDHRVLNFDAVGRLTSLQDRIGNTQTITRDGSHRISTVADQLGRSLSFSYDTSNRITGITSTPSGISVSLTYDSGTNCYTGDLCSVQESDGSTWSYQYYDPSTKGGNHLLYKVIDANGHVEESNTYALTNLGNGDNHYRVTHQERDSGKNAYDYAYGISGTVGTTTISNSTVGQTTTYTWDQSLQQVLSVNGALCGCKGSSVTYTYDLFGRMLTMSEGGQKTRAFAYGRDKIFTSPDGSTTYVSTAYPSVTDTYDYGIQTAQQGPATRHVQYAYYAMSDARSDLVNTISEPSVDTLGNAVTSTLTYNTSGLLTSEARQGYISGTSTTYTTSYAYDSLGRITSATGPRTDVTQQTIFAYYPDTDTDLARRGQLETVSRYVSGSLNLTTTYASSSLSSPYNTYTIYGKPRSVTDPNGVVTDLDYDTLGRLTASTLKGVSGDPADLVTAFAYDAVGNMTGITKPAGNRLSFVYDTVNNLTNTVILDASGNQRDQLLAAYDTVSEMTSRSAQACGTPASTCASWATKQSESYAYASSGNLGTITYPTIGTKAFSWSSSGDLLNSTIGDSSYSVATNYQYDLAHNPTLMGLGRLQFAATLYTKDLQGNPDRVTARMQSSVSTYYQHDDFGRVRKETSLFIGTRTYSYDAAGNQTSYTDGNGATTSTTYDPLNRPLSASSVKSGLTTETVTWSDDNATSGTYRLGRLYQTTDSSGSKTYTYDRRGNITTCAQVANGTTYTTSYGHDANGNTTSMTLPSGRALTYAFDYADRPYSVSGTYGGTGTTYVSATTYAPFGPRLATSFGNGTTQAFTYDQRYLSTENKLTTGGSTLSDLTYTTNAVGYITRITDALNSAYNIAYVYGGNATNMLTDANTGSGLWGKWHFADAYAQNMTQSLVSNSNARVFKLSQRTGQIQSTFLPSSGATQSVSYDAAGNQTAVASLTYTYSTRNLLASGEGITYTYDGYRQRVSATTTIGGSSATETSLYGPGRHLEMQTSVSGGSVAYDYIWLGNLPVAEEDIAGSHTYWTVVDHIGSPIILTNSSATIAWQADYRPLGKLYQVRTGSSIHQPLRFPGQEDELFDGSNGFNGFSTRSYNGMRWYRPQFGRYTQADPLEYAGSPYNLYAYVDNNPVNYVDPLGLWTINIGISGNINIPLVGPIGISGGGFGGIVFDGTRLAWYGGGGGGLGAGGGGSLGLQIGASNGASVCDLRGPFGSVSGSGGEGIIGGAEVYTGSGSHGQSVTGGNLFIGAGGGTPVSGTAGVSVLQQHNWRFSIS